MAVFIAFFVGLLAGIFFTSLLAVNHNEAEDIELIDWTEEGDEDETH